MNNASLLTSYYSDHNQSIIKADAINPNYIAHSCTDNYNDLSPLLFRLGNDRKVLEYLKKCSFIVLKVSNFSFISVKCQQPY